MTGKASLIADVAKESGVSLMSLVTVGSGIAGELADVFPAVDAGMRDTMLSLLSGAPAHRAAGAHEDEALKWPVELRSGIPALRVLAAMVNKDRWSFSKKIQEDTVRIHLLSGLDIGDALDELAGKGLIVRRKGSPAIMYLNLDRRSDVLACVDFWKRNKAALLAERRSGK